MKKKIKWYVAVKWEISSIGRGTEGASEVHVPTLLEKDPTYTNRLCACVDVVHILYTIFRILTAILKGNRIAAMYTWTH